MTCYLCLQKEFEEECVKQHTKANNKYMNNHDKNSESSYLEYLDANNLDGWTMSQKLPVRNSKWIEKR